MFNILLDTQFGPWLQCKLLIKLYYIITKFLLYCKLFRCVYIMCMYTSPRFPFLPFFIYCFLCVTLFSFYCNLLFIADANKDYETVRSKGEDEKVLDDQIHRGTVKQEWLKATQKQVGEHNVFSPMTAKKKFNFIFFFQHYPTARPQLCIALPKFGQKL